MKIYNSGLYGIVVNLKLLIYTSLWAPIKPICDMYVVSSHLVQITCNVILNMSIFKWSNFSEINELLHAITIRYYIKKTLKFKIETDEITSRYSADS